MIVCIERVSKTIIRTIPKVTLIHLLKNKGGDLVLGWGGHKDLQNMKIILHTFSLGSGGQKDFHFRGIGQKNVRLSLCVLNYSSI